MPVTLLAALLLAADPAAAPDGGRIADPSLMKALTDGQGHYLVYNGTRPLDGPTFYGDGKTFYELRVHGGGANGTESWSLNLWDPRVRAGVWMKDSGAGYEAECGSKTTALKPVPADALAPLLSAAFKPPLWTRLPHQLLRDDAGTYYFIDRVRDEARRDFRVFMGPRGKLKQLPLKDIVDDSQGTIYATKSGNLRLVANTSNYAWVKGKVETKLLDVPVVDNVRMIYMDLGPYSGQPLGTPCDDLM